VTRVPRRAVVSTPHANFFGPFSGAGAMRAPAPPAVFDRSQYLPAHLREAYGAATARAAAAYGA